MWYYSTGAKAIAVFPRFFASLLFTVDFCDTQSPGLFSFGPFDDLHGGVIGFAPFGAHIEMFKHDFVLAHAGG